MQILQKILAFFIIALFLLLSCDKTDTSAKNKNAEPQLTLENIAKFTYVAIKHTGPYQDYELLKEEFLYEIKKQQIISTGAPFILYLNNPENTSQNKLEWEIGVPTVEGTMVKEPLILKNWVYEHIAKVEKEEDIPITQNIYPLIFEQVSEKNLAYNGPTAVRILSDMADDTSGIIGTEIWIPLAVHNQFAE